MKMKTGVKCSYYFLVFLDTTNLTWKPLQKSRSFICNAQHCIVSSIPSAKVKSGGSGCGGGSWWYSSKFVDGGARWRPLYGGAKKAGEFV
jgi:hypothetical protein